MDVTKIKKRPVRKEKKHCESNLCFAVILYRLFCCLFLANSRVCSFCSSVWFPLHCCAWTLFLYKYAFHFSESFFKFSLYCLHFSALDCLVSSLGFGGCLCLRPRRQYKYKVSSDSNINKFTVRDSYACPHSNWKSCYPLKKKKTVQTASKLCK